MKVGMSDLERYLELKAKFWSPSTLKSERARLTPIVDQEFSPDSLYQACLSKGMSQYSIKTLFIRLNNLCQTLALGDEIQVYMQGAWRKFKYAYTRKPADISYEEAITLINRIPSVHVRNAALYLIHSGLRISERHSVIDGYIKGKGGVVRKLFAKPISDVVVSDSTLRRHLKLVGLTPHMLRKISATHLAQSGRLSLPDLMKIFGWSSLETARSYLGFKKDVELEEIMVDSFNQACDNK